MELDLDAIEARKSGPAGSENWMLVYLTVPERDALVAEVRRLRAIETLAREALAELDAQPELCHWPGCERQVPPAMWGCKPHWAHPDAVWYTGAALRDALEADRG